MKTQKTHIAKQLKFIKLLKTIVVCMIGLSFMLEFVMFNFIAIHKEQKIAETSYKEVSNELVAVTEVITIKVSEEYKAFLDYVEQKNEEQSRNKTENTQLVAFNLFFINNYSFQFESGFYLDKQPQNAFYKEPFTHKILSNIFHPPQV